jgi:hypothetical protein
VTVEEDERTERLLVSRRADPLRKEMVEETVDLGCPELRRMTSGVEDDVAPDPAAIGTLRTKAVVTTPKLSRKSL